MTGLSDSQIVARRHPSIASNDITEDTRLRSGRPKIVVKIDCTEHIQDIHMQVGICIGIFTLLFKAKDHSIGDSISAVCFCVSVRYFLFVGISVLLREQTKAIAKKQRNSKRCTVHTPTMKQTRSPHKIHIEMLLAFPILTNYIVLTKYNAKNKLLHPRHRGIGFR